MQDARVSSRSREHSKVKTMMRDLFAEELDALHARSLDRHLREITGAQGSEIEIAGRRFINFSSNDYLGLANDPRLREAATAAIDEFGVGAGASRLISGTQSPHVSLERALAQWKETEAALCFSSGYAAALGTIPALVVVGPNGRGLAAAENLTDDVDVQMGTLSKALGASGGYICGSRDLIEWLINRARSFIYSTAPPPAIAAAAFAAVDFLSSSQGEERRLSLWKRIRLMRELLPRLEVGRSALSAGRLNNSNQCSTLNDIGSAIFPLIVGNEKAALDLAAGLQSEGFLVPAIRYPTVA